MSEPSESSNGLPSEFNDHYNRLMEAQQQQRSMTTLSHDVQVARIEAGKKIGSVLNPTTEFVRDPARGTDFDRRHNDLLVVREVIEALLRQDPEEMRDMKARIADSGGFFLNYQGEGEERLREVYDFSDPARGGWLMAETTGVPLNMDGRAVTSVPVLGADGQFLIPPDNNEVVPPDFPLLSGNDAVVAGDNISTVLEGMPSRGMLIADISSVREYGKYGFAALTEDAAFRRVIDEINTVRENKIQYILAAIAGVRALVLKGNTLAGPEMDPGFTNFRSLSLHMNRRHAPGFLHGKQRRREVAVELPGGDTGHLIVDWYVTVQEVNDIVKNMTIRIVDEEYPRRVA